MDEPTHESPLSRRLAHLDGTTITVDVVAAGRPASGRDFTDEDIDRILHHLRKRRRGGPLGI